MVLDSRMAWQFRAGFLQGISIRGAGGSGTQGHEMTKGGKVERPIKAFEDAMNCLIERKKSENLRYISKYGVIAQSRRITNLIIDANIDFRLSRFAE